MMKMSSLATLDVANGANDADVSGYYDRALLPRRNRKYLWKGYGDEKTLPENEGRDIVWARYGHLSDATEELVDGVTPDPHEIDRTPVTDRVKQRGAFIRYTDQIQQVGLDRGLLKVFGTALNDQMNSTLDVLCRDEIIACTQVRYAGGVGRDTVDRAIQSTDFQWAENILRNDSVEMITEKIDLSAKYGAMAIDAAYVGLGDIDMLPDLEALGTAFTPVRNYASQGNLLPGEVGTVGRTRVCLGPEGKTYVAAADGTGGGADVTATYRNNNDDGDGTGHGTVYTLLVMGKNYYGDVKVGKGSVKSIVKKIGSGGAEDALDQRGSAGWKTWQANPILDDECAVRLEFLVRDIANAAADA